MASSSTSQRAPQRTGHHTPRLGVASRQRHVTMISLGGIIGAGLSVASSATLNTVGPAASLSYLVAGIVVLLVMRMLGEMALALPAASLLRTKRQADGAHADTRTGYRSELDARALQGER